MIIIMMVLVKRRKMMTMMLTMMLTMMQKNLKISQSSKLRFLFAFPLNPFFRFLFALEILLPCLPTSPFHQKASKQFTKYWRIPHFYNFFPKYWRFHILQILSFFVYIFMLNNFLNHWQKSPFTCSWFCILIYFSEQFLKISTDAGNWEFHLCPTFLFAQETTSAHLLSFLGFLLFMVFAPPPPFLLDIAVC